MDAMDNGYSLTLYFPIMSTLVIKNVGVITNDEYTRHPALPEVWCSHFAFWKLLFLLDLLLTAGLQRRRKTEVTSVSLCLHLELVFSLFFTSLDCQELSLDQR